MFDQSKAMAKLTPKQRVFVREYMDNGGVGVKAAAVAYKKDISDPKQYSVAGSVAVENLKKPAIRSSLANYNNLFESAMINTVEEWKESAKPRQREIAMDLAKYAHDKIHGKATQRTEVRSEHVKVVLDLTGTLSPDEEEPS